MIEIYMHGHSEVGWKEGVFQAERESWREEKKG